MIWALESELAPAASFRSAVEHDLKDICPAMRFDDEWCCQLAQTITDFCEARFRDFVVPVDYYGLIMARVLWAVGQQESGEQAIERWCKPDVAVVCTPFEKEFFGGQVPWALCQTGIVRSANWLTLGESGGWIVDFEKLNLSQDESMELTYFAVIGRMLQGIAHVWDSGKGGGWLGIKGLNRLTRGIYGGRNHAKAESLKAEILSFAGRVLKCCGSNRHWVSVPQVKII